MSTCSMLLFSLETFSFLIFLTKNCKTKIKYISLHTKFNIMKRLILILSAVILFSCCTKTLYDYKDYDDAVYSFITTEEKADIKNISKSYQAIVGEKELKRKKGAVEQQRIPPGACADYAYILYQQKDTAGAIFWFQREMELYPESHTYIVKLKQELGL